MTSQHTERNGKGRNGTGRDGKERNGTGRNERGRDGKGREGKGREGKGRDEERDGTRGGYWKPMGVRSLERLSRDLMSSCLQNSSMAGKVGFWPERMKSMAHLRAMFSI